MYRKGRYKEGRNPWQQAQHAQPYTDLLQALKRELFKVCALNRWDFNFCVRSGDAPKTDGDETNMLYTP